MKMPVAWHARRLENMRDFRARLRKQRDDLRAKIARVSNDCCELQDQLDRAAREGRESFDQDRYNIPRQLRGDK